MRSADEGPNSGVPDPTGTNSEGPEEACRRGVCWAGSGEVLWNWAKSFTGGPELREEEGERGGGTEEAEVGERVESPGRVGTGMEAAFFRSSTDGSLTPACTWQTHIQITLITYK